MTTYMGQDSVIVAHGDAGEVNVFLNSCPHRGNRVCFADSGRDRAFTCNYHGWSFGLDGALRKMPKMGLYKSTPGFRMADWGLKRARVESYKGLIFATFCEEAPSLGDWLGARSRQEAITARLGKFRADMWGSVASATIFPNFSFLPGYFTFRTFQPKGPTATEIHAWTLVPRNMPDDIKDRFRRGSMRTFSPSGLLEMDDGENWEHSTAANAGWVTRHQRLCYAMAPAGQVDDPSLAGTVHSGQSSDANQRLFYKRWAEMMDAESWAEMPLAPPTIMMEAAE